MGGLLFWGLLEGLSFDTDDVLVTMERVCVCATSCLWDGTPGSWWEREGNGRSQLQFVEGEV